MVGVRCARSGVVLFNVDSYDSYLGNVCFGKGTGHGVGAALNVHEGPQSISSRFGNLTGLQAGMIVSNEPGYYEDGCFGIRIEVCRAGTLHD